MFAELLSEVGYSQLTIEGVTTKMRARTASDEEKAEMWPTMTKEWPAYDDYQKKTDREIPVFVLERHQVRKVLTPGSAFLPPRNIFTSSACSALRMTPVTS